MRSLNAVFVRRFLCCGALIRSVRVFVMTRCCLIHSTNAKLQSQLHAAGLGKCVPSWQFLTCTRSCAFLATTVVVSPSRMCSMPFCNRITWRLTDKQSASLQQGSVAGVAGVPSSASAPICIRNSRLLKRRRLVRVALRVKDSREARQLPATSLVRNANCRLLIRGVFAFILRSYRCS